MIDKHEEYMQHAYRLAQKGWGRTSPNPMVGAVLVKKGKVIAEGWHACLGTDHAEVMALKKAGSLAHGADLYVTLEPCNHFGRTPPCTQALLAAGIKRVYIGVLDPNPKMSGASVQLLRKSGIKVEVGFLQEPITRLNESFHKYITQQMPFVTAKIAQTLDGKTATIKGESKWITSPEARDFARGLRQGFDAILVGANTVVQDDPLLTTALSEKRLKKVIVDSRLIISPKAQLFKDTLAQDVITITTAKATPARRKLFAGKAQVWVAPLKGNLVDLHWAFKELAKNEIAAILIEGGGHLIGSALQEGLVDKVHVYTAFKLMGEGLSSIRGLSVPKLSQVVTLSDITVDVLENEIFIQGYPHVHRDH